MKKMKKHFLKIFIFISVILMSIVPIHALGEDHQNNHTIIVEKGDTLYNLSKKHNTTVDQLKELNNLSSNTIIIGHELVISEELATFFKVVAGSFSEKKNAEKRVAFLKEKGLDAYIAETELEGETYYRVQVGAFHEKENAYKQQEKLKEVGISSSFITVDEM